MQHRLDVSRRNAVAGQRLLEQIAGLQNAENMVQTVAANHQPRVFGIDNTLANRFLIFIKIDHEHFTTRRHDRGDALFVQAQHVGNQFLLALVKDAGLRALLHQHVNFVVGHRLLLLGASAEKTQDGRTGTRQDDDQRMGDAGQHDHRSSDQRSDALRGQHGQAFGHQFAHHHRNVSQADHGDRQCDGSCVRGQQRNAGKPCREWIRHRGFANGAAQNADRGNADLDGGKETGRFLMQRECRLGPQATVIGQILESGLAG